jgi:hypothetical protein
MRSFLVRGECGFDSLSSNIAVGANLPSKAKSTETQRRSVVKCRDAKQRSDDTCGRKARDQIQSAKETIVAILVGSNV